MRRPSPALVIAFIALLGAWGGPAVARALITGKDVRNGSLTSADIRDRSLRGRDIRSNTITGRNVQRLTGRDILPNGLDGSDIDEDTLDKVPRAARADRAKTADTATALAGARVARVAYAEAAGTDAVTLFEGGGLVVSASCNAAGRLVASAAPAAGTTGAIVRVHVVRPGSPPEDRLVTDSDFGGADAVDLVPGGNGDDLTGTLTYWTPNGDVVTMDYLTQDGLPDARGYQCALAGTAIHSTA